MRARSVLLFASFALGLVGESRGQTHVDDIPWPAMSDYGNSGDFKRAIAGTFTGTGEVHAIQVRDQDAVFVYGPGEMSVVISTGFAFNDVDTLPSSGLTADHDAWVGVGPGGLTKCWYDGASGFDSLPIDASSLWQGARLIRTGDIDNNARPDLIAVLSDRQTIATKLWTLSGYVDGPTIFLGHPIRNIDVLNWDGVGSLELLVSSTDGVRVYDPFLSTPLVDYRGLDSSKDQVCVMRDSTGLADQVAWTTQAIGEEVLIRFDQNGLDLPVGLGTWEVAALEAGNVGVDFDMDVFMVLSSHDQVVLMVNQQDDSGDGFSTDPDWCRSLPMGIGASPSVGNIAKPIVADLDRDGFVDLFLGVDETDAVRHFYGPLEDDQYIAGMIRDFSTSTPICLIDLGAGLAKLDLTVIYSGLPTGASFELQVWESPDYGDQPLTGYQNCWLANPTPNPAVQDGYDLSFEMQLPANTSNSETVSFIRIRPIETDPTFQVVGPALIGFVIRDKFIIPTGLEMHPSWAAPVETEDCTSGPGAPERLGAIARASRITGMINGGFPAPGTNCSPNTSGGSTN